MTEDTAVLDRTRLIDYARGELRGEAVYRGYKPRTAQLARLSEVLPRAHLVVVSGAWCPDCRVQVPKLARIAEHLPRGWTFELRGDDEVTREKLQVRAIPTFIVQAAPDGAELGRIIESPDSGEGIEGDLLAIATQAAGSAPVATAR